MIGFLGGTGPEGRGLALRLAMAGERVVLGSRERGKAAEAAAAVGRLAPGLAVEGATNEEAARRSDIVFVCVPYAGQRDTLAAVKADLAGKVVVDVVAPVTVSKGVARALHVEEGSAAEQAQAMLERSKVVSAFHTVSASVLLRPQASVGADVVVCSDDPDARALVMTLAEKVRGIRAVNGGGLQNAAYLESFTAMLININRMYKTHSSLRIVGI